jgi:hypothetical protein
MIFSAGVLAFILEHYKFDIFGNEIYAVLIAPAVLLCFFYILGRQIFEYDSDGEAVHFKNRSIVPFIRPLSDEFPKYKIINYDVFRFLFYKRLFVRISSKTSKSLVLRYEISYLGQKDISDLKRSLNKIIQANRQKTSEDKA